MTTSFKTLPIVDLAPLSSDNASEEELCALTSKLDQVFRTVGFAYLINVPLSLNHDDVLGLAKDFFSLPEEAKMGVAKRTFRRANKNTYRGYFPAQPGEDSQNLKAGFELGPPHRLPPSSKPSNSPFVLTEPNCFPPLSVFPPRERLETLYAELSSLANTLLVLLASVLGRSPASFTSIMRNSVSTLRLLHYPRGPDAETEAEADPDADNDADPDADHELTCTPHTDSGLLTLLHQDPTGGLEVRNTDGDWIPAPYVPGSVVVNVGDLMAQMSRRRFVATRHRVRRVGGERYSVPFFCEPGVDAVVAAESGRQLRYEEFLLDKMGTWVEFQDPMEEAESLSARSNLSARSDVAAY